MQENPIILAMSDINKMMGLFPNEIKLTEYIDKGGQGVVYKGKIGSENAAIKIFLPGQIIKRIDREIELLQQINSPNISSLLWAGEINYSGQKLYSLATKFISGTTLDKLLNIKPLTDMQMYHLARDVGNAISIIWEKKVVHRDLKPSNIIIKPDNSACIIDLSYARHIDRSPLTAIGNTWGTYGYLSPEQTKTIRQLTCKSDIFSLGVILVESILGKHPSGYDQLRLLSMSCHEVLPELIEQKDYSDFIKTMLHPRQTARPMPEEVVSFFDGIISNKGE